MPVNSDTAVDSCSILSVFAFCGFPTKETRFSELDTEFLGVLVRRIDCRLWLAVPEVVLAEEGSTSIFLKASATSILSLPSLACHYFTFLV